MWLCIHAKYPARCVKSSRCVTIESFLLIYCALDLSLSCLLFYIHQLTARCAPLPDEMHRELRGESFSLTKGPFPINKEVEFAMKIIKSAIEHPPREFGLASLSDYY